VSHDLRTPLAAITGAATTLRDATTAVDLEQRGELLATICEEAERLERLVANLLDMTRLESRSIEIKRDWVSLEEVVGAALGRLEPVLATRAVEVSVPAELPLVSADAVLLEQMMVNLVDNAAKHTVGPIRVAARLDRGELELEVADRGPGIPAGEEERIFEKFGRGSGSNPRIRGVGLGLAICRGIAHVHGGTISAHNRPGGGACFRVRLPVGGDAPGVPDEPELRAHAGAAP
jgi:two-component system sensor histidine kinase KdpD